MWDTCQVNFWFLAISVDYLQLTNSTIYFLLTILIVCEKLPIYCLLLANCFSNLLLVNYFNCFCYSSWLLEICVCWPTRFNVTADPYQHTNLYLCVYFPLLHKCDHTFLNLIYFFFQISWVPLATIGGTLLGYTSPAWGSLLHSVLI